MQNSFLFQVFGALEKKDHARLRKFLASPLHNRREDVRRLFEFLVRQREPGIESPDKKEAWEAVFPQQPYDADALNLTMTYLLGLVEDYLAYEEWASDPVQRRLFLVRALRKREIGPHFERQARVLERTRHGQTQRHAGFYLTEYQAQYETFAYRVVSQRNWQDNLPALTDALTHFFALENLRWAGMVQSLRRRTDDALPDPPLAAPVEEWAARPGATPSVALLYQSLLTLRDSENTEHFQHLKQLLPRVSELFPTAESRDIYMAAINFCIHRQNRGDRAFAREAFDLYRRALTDGLLLENGVLPKYTYNNIHALAQLVGEIEWAREFLDAYAAHLAPAERENIYRYNLAIHHFRRSEYHRALELLRTVLFSEVFINLDVRRMLLRSYYELGEWPALASLLDSFRAFLRRQKGLGTHRESYLNLIRFTQKLAKLPSLRRAQAAHLVQKIRNAERVAEREWLLEKCGQGVV